MERCRCLVAVCLLGSAVAAAQPAPRARLGLVYALSQRDSRQTDGVLPLHFSGLAPSQLRLSGAYVFLTAGLPIGAAVDGAFERFAITGKNLADEPITRLLTGLRVSGAATVRWSPRADLWAEGHLGYAYTRLPIVDTSMVELKAAAMTHHGPLVEAVAGYEPPGMLSGQLRARLMPVAIGGSTASVPSRAAQLLLGAQLAVGSFQVAGLRLVGVLDYELALAGARQDVAVLSQTAHHFGVGVRLELPEPSARPLVEPSVLVPPGGKVEAAPAPVPAPAQPTGPGRIRGSVVGTAPGGAKVPLPEVKVDAGGASVRTRTDGSFVLEKVGPGLVPLKVVAQGYKPAEEVVSVPPEGEATLELVLEKESVKAMASLKGQVRSTSGAPVAAVLRIPEAKLVIRAGRDGRFLARLPAGRYTLRFEARGYISQSKVIEVASGDQALFYIDLSREER